MNISNSNEKDNYLWNSIGGILNALQSVFILMVIQRTAGIEAAGIFSIAWATGNLFMNLGNYGVRNYQISDLDEQFSFRDYLRHRYLTVGLMLAFSAAYSLYSYLFGTYSVEKTWIVFLMCVLKSLDCLEEVFEGRLQQRGRLDLSGKFMTVRILMVIGGMLAVLAIRKDLLLATVAAILIQIAVILLMIRKDSSVIHYEAVSHDPHAFRHLMKFCFPVCAVNFLAFYITNAPKYAIDGIMSEAMQAKYNFIAMPVFVIQMLNMFIYQPTLVHMTVSWVDHDIHSFIKRFLRIVGGLAVVSAVVLLGAYLLGIPVLSWLYATDLSDLKTEFMLIMVGSIFYAMNGYYTAVLTIMRAQNNILPVYIIGGLFSLLVTNNMVANDGIHGAVMAYVYAMILIMVILTAVFVHVLRRGDQK